MIDLDLTGMSGDDLEQRWNPPTDSYLCTIVDVTSQEKTGAMLVHWRVDHGEWRGKIFEDRYNLPAYCMDAKDMPGQIKKLWMLTYRLGLSTKEDQHKRLNIDEKKMVGIQRVLDIKYEQATKGAYVGKWFSNVDYGAYWSLERPEISASTRAKLGLPLLQGQSVPTASQPAPVPAKPARGGKGAATNSQPTPAPFDPSEV